MDENEKFWDTQVELPIDPAKYDIGKLEAAWMENPPKDTDDIYKLMDKFYLNPKERRFALYPEMENYEPDTTSNPYLNPELFPEKFPSDYEYPEAYIEVKPTGGGWEVNRYIYEKDEGWFSFGSHEYVWYMLDEVIRLEANKLNNKEWKPNG